MDTKKILLAEDDSKDVELTLTALEEHNVVVLTSSREDQDIVESYHLGMNAYVVKPVAFDNFIDVVKQLGLFWVLTNEVPPGNGQ